MKKIYTIASSLLIALSNNSSAAPDSTGNNAGLPTQSVSIEEMVGDKRQFLQLQVNKVFQEHKKVGLLSITSYAADYKDNLSANEFQNTSLIYHQIAGGVSINSGVSFTSIEGLKNFVGLQYMLQRKSFSLIYLPSYFFSGNHKLSNLLLLEYKPALGKNWSLYSRAQLHYNQDISKGNHFRSYAYTRIGLSYKNYSFGLAHNYDCYGAQKSSRNNYGVFIKISM